MTESNDLDLGPAIDPPDEPDFDGEGPEQTAERMGLVALTVDSLRRPAAAMRRLADHPGRRWIWPLLALALVRVAVIFAQSSASQAATIAATQASMANQPGMDPEMAAQMSQSMQRFGMIGTVFGAVGAFVGVFIGALVVAGILHLLATVMGGQQGFTQVFTVTSWARLPLIIGGLLQLAYALTGGYDPCPRGLAGLVDCGGDPSDPTAVSLWSPLLAQIELWNLWHLLLLGLGVQAVARLTRRKAAVAVLIVLAIIVGMGLAGTFVSRAVAGFAG